MRLAEFITERTQWERNKDVQHDQIFTRPEVASQFAQWVKARTKDATRTIEPSAGDGSILKHFPGAIAYDLQPRGTGITQADWFTTQHERGEKTLVVGNPPFGRGGHLAAQFINHAAPFADYIAMILPRTFRKESVQNKISLDFALADEYILPKNSFYLPHEGDAKTPYDVPCVAQLWVRKARQKAPKATSEYIQFVQPGEGDIAILYKGRRAGDIFNVQQAMPRANSFIFIKILKDKDRVLQALKTADWSDIKTNTVGAYSLSRNEIVQKLNSML